MSKESEEYSEDELRELLNDALNLQPEELRTFQNGKELRGKLKSIVSEYLDSFFKLTIADAY